MPSSLRQTSLTCLTGGAQQPDAGREAGAGGGHQAAAAQQGRHRADHQAAGERGRQVSDQQQIRN